MAHKKTGRPRLGVQRKLSHTISARFTGLEGRLIRAAAEEESERLNRKVSPSHLVRRIVAEHFAAQLSSAAEAA